MPYVIFFPTQYHSRLYDSVIARLLFSFSPQMRRIRTYHSHINPPTFHAPSLHDFDSRSVARDDILVKVNLQVSQKRTAMSRKRNVEGIANTQSPFVARKRANACIVRPASALTGSTKPKPPPKPVWRAVMPKLRSAGRVSTNALLANLLFYNTLHYATFSPLLCKDREIPVNSLDSSDSTRLMNGNISQRKLFIDFSELAMAIVLIKYRR